MELPRTLNRAERICRTYRHIRPSALQPHSGVFCFDAGWGAAGCTRFAGLTCRTPRGIGPARSLAPFPWGTIQAFVFVIEEACVSSSLYSDNQGDVDALARRVAALTSLSSKQAAVISRGLLGRKVLKIKSSSLGGLFRSIDKDIDTKRLRDEFIKSGLIERIDETGVDGRPAIYSINAKVSELIVVEGTEDLDDGFDAEEKQAPAGEPDAVKGAPKAREDVPAKDGSAETAQAGESVTESVGDAREKQQAPVAASPEVAQKEARSAADDKPVPFVSKVGRGARVHRRMDTQKPAQGSERDHAEQQQKGVDAAVKDQKPAVHAMGSKKKQPSTLDAIVETAEKKAAASKSAPASKKDAAPKSREEKHGHNAAPVHEGRREREASKDEQASASTK